MPLPLIQPHNEVILPRRFGPQERAALLGRRVTGSVWGPSLYYSHSKAREQDARLFLSPPSSQPLPLREKNPGLCEHVLLSYPSQ